MGEEWHFQEKLGTGRRGNEDRYHAGKTEVEFTELSLLPSAPWPVCLGANESCPSGHQKRGDLKEAVSPPGINWQLFYI